MRQAWDCSWILLWKTVTNKEVSRRDDCSRRYWNIDHSCTGILLFDWMVMIGWLIDLLTDRLSIQWFWWSLAFAKAWWNFIDQFFFYFYRASPYLSSLLIVHIITCMDLYNLYIYIYTPHIHLKLAPFRWRNILRGLRRCSLRAQQSKWHRLTNQWTARRD